LLNPEKLMKNKILPVLFALFALFTANNASAYYSPSTGRWLSRDPSGELGFETLRAAYTTPQIGQVTSTASLPPSRLFNRDSIAVKADPNRYAFVRNEPIDLVDREGLSWWRNLLCPCKCQSVTVTGKPVAPPGVGWYIPGTYAQYGNLMTVTWTVSGNPKSCTYGQNEKGQIDATPLSGQPAKSPYYGSDYPDVSGIVPITYGSGTATYQDYMGIKFYAPRDDGDWNYFFDLGIDFICTSSDGTRITGNHLDYKASGKFHF
jgi:hypothetical protein